MKRYKHDPLMNQPDPMAALAELAPEWATHICWGEFGYAFWQDHLGSGPTWWAPGKWEASDIGHDPSNAIASINLRTGTVYLQAADGTTTEVTRKEWDV